jgi:hypothetical protein
MKRRNEIRERKKRKKKKEEEAAPSKFEGRDFHSGSWFITSPGLAKARGLLCFHP